MTEMNRQDHVKTQQDEEKNENKGEAIIYCVRRTNPRLHPSRQFCSVRIEKSHQNSLLKYQSSS